MKTELSVGMLLMAAAGCSWLPSVGPDYEQPKAEIPELPRPDAGLPTTNLTSVGEYVPAAGEADGVGLLAGRAGGAEPGVGGAPPGSGHRAGQAAAHEVEGRQPGDLLQQVHAVPLEVSDAVEKSHGPHASAAPR